MPKLPYYSSNYCRTPTPMKSCNASPFLIYLHTCSTGIQSFSNSFSKILQSPLHINRGGAKQLKCLISPNLPWYIMYIPISGRVEPIHLDDPLKSSLDKLLDSVQSLSACVSGP